MSALNGWYIAALVIVALLAIYAPRIAGGVVILVALTLAVRIAEKNLI